MKAKLLVNNLIIMFALMLSVMGVAFAWFYDGKANSIGGLNLSSANAEALLVSIDGVNYKTNAELDVDENFKFLPVTGDGVNFYAASIAAQTDRPYKFSSLSYDAENQAANSYLEFKVYLRASAKSKVYLGNGMSIKPDATIRTGSGSDNKSPQGDFTADYIAAASRVSVSTLSGETETLKQIFIPNDTYQLSEAGGVYTMNENGTPEANYSYYDYVTGAANNHTFAIDGSEAVPMSNLSSELVLTESVLRGYYSSSGVTEAPFVFEFTDAEKVGAYYEKTVVIRVWIEGYDRESRDLLKTGKLKMNIQFNPVKVED